LPENVFDSARKTAMLTCKITLPDSPTRLFCPKNGFARFRGCSPQPPGSYAYGSLLKTQFKVRCVCFLNHGLLIRLAVRFCVFSLCCFELRCSWFPGKT